MATAAAAGWLSAADRLALLLQRYGVAEDKVAQQLGWPLEQLRAYVSPEARRQQAASDVRLRPLVAVPRAPVSRAGLALGWLSPEVEARLDSEVDS